jgi:two-component sensor histidine kinase
MLRTSIWLQLSLGWVPMVGLFALLVMSAHGVPLGGALAGAATMVAAAALLGLGVYRFSERVPWPHPLDLRFFIIQALAALVYALAWCGLDFASKSAIESVIVSLHRGRYSFTAVEGPGFGPSFIVGVWLYIMIAGIAYANRAAARTAQLEALAAQTQLAALRAQLHPHLLFNSLHTIVQLIALDPTRATRAAEQLADLLRLSLADPREVISLEQEWDFVQRYLAIESLRLGERLRLRESIDATAMSALVPAFALQTLVENSVRHAVAMRAQATTLSIAARIDGDGLTLETADDGPGIEPADLQRSAGTGLARLRERLTWLCGERAKLDIDSAPGRGFRATLHLPQAALRKAMQRAQTDDHDA